MTLEELQNLRNDDCVKLHGEIFRFTGQAEYDGKGKVVSCICNNINPSKFSSITITKDTISGNCCGHYTNCLDYVIKLSEKEVLEIQLKDAEEQVQKETARVGSIKAKIEELSKPKLKIGGLYKFEKFGNDFIGVIINADRNSGWYGITNHRLNGIITYNTGHYKVTEITNPKYSHIGPTILEFMKLNPENFK